jgi:nucleotide-binding universal stress UspA family protein
MFAKILVPLDRSPLAEQALGTAAAIARASKAGVDLVLVHQVFPFDGFGDAPWNALEREDEHKYLDGIAAELLAGAAVPATHAIVNGEAVEMIGKRSRDIEADLIVMTSHGRTGLSRVWIGSVATGVIKQAAVPVLMLRPVKSPDDLKAAHHLFKKILIPVDGSALAADIVVPAVNLAKCAGATIELLRVVEPVPLATADMGTPFAYPVMLQDDAATNHLLEEGRSEVGELAKRLGESESVKVNATAIVAGHVSNAIIDFARGHDVDLIAMATHGRGASRLVFGSVADKVVRASGLPMLLLKPIGVTESKQEPQAEAETETSALAPV